MGPNRRTPARLRGEILALLEEFDYQLLPLEEAMKEFGENFDLPAFKRAFEKGAGVPGSHKVQAVERSFVRGPQSGKGDRRLPLRQVEEVSKRPIRNRARLHAGHGRPGARSRKAGSRVGCGVHRAIQALDRVVPGRLSVRRGLTLPPTSARGAGPARFGKRHRSASATTAASAPIAAVIQAT